MSDKRYITLLLLLIGVSSILGFMEVGIFSSSTDLALMYKILFIVVDLGLLLTIYLFVKSDKEEIN